MKDPKKSQSSENEVEDVEGLMALDQLKDQASEEDDFLKFEQKKDSTIDIINKNQQKEYLFGEVEFDKKEFNTHFFMALLILAFVVLKVDANFIRNQETEEMLMHAIAGVTILEMIAQLAGAFRILTPLWLIIIINKFPPMVPSVYRFKFAFWGMETIFKVDYMSQLVRVKIPWYEIATVEFKQNKNFDYLELLNGKGMSIGVVHLGIARKQDILNSLKLHVSEDHPLVKKLKTMLEIKG
jgi:hypothetical protein